jgi:hypothetical protein
MSISLSPVVGNEAVEQGEINMDTDYYTVVERLFSSVVKAHPVVPG